MLTLSCNHKFHLQCLASNIQAQNKECPLCRTAIDASVVQLFVGSGQPPIQHQQQQVLPFPFRNLRRIPPVNVSHFCTRVLSKV
jgi:hypothetical protein